MRRLSYVAALALVVTLALAPTAGAQGQTMTVSIEDFFFSPANMTVAPGTTVTWVNNGQAPHTSTADDGAWDSGTLQPGESFSFTFDQAGTYTYLCSIHPDMTGAITVSGGGGATSASLTASPTAASATATPAAGKTLPGTGAGNSWLVLAAVLALLGGAGLMTRALLRRRGAS
jgi:LPXTG-motif cell wall-anchored protein